MRPGKILLGHVWDVGGGLLIAGCNAGGNVVA